MWDWAIWAGLVLGTAAGIAALALLAVRTLSAWRTFKETHRAVVDGLSDLAGTAEAIADRLAAAGDNAELEASLGRLRVSLDRLAVLRAAIDEVDDTVGRAIAVLPRK
jgi:hypothetical protein